MTTLRAYLLVGCLLSPLTQAADLGTWGDLWPVREQDMLQLITQRLQTLQTTGKWDQTMDEFKQRVIENSQRPAPVEGIKRAEKYEQRWFDPSIRLTEDLKDNKGRVFARKGDVVNPLKTVPFVQTLYFINGDDADQIAWMKRQVPETLMSKIILVRGSVPETSAVLDSRIYFDQNGVLSQRFGLTTVPARITPAPSGERLNIETFPVK
ncbi:MULTISPECIES: type-F conjugative transfer system protein TraW [Klebsiella]|uniref:Type-F conjugative transfer system protein TraW n=1 Tax=Klebsiella michiganensis TaxID=1134687 RepID=A0A1Q8YUB3_9ENTR|nr:MULTISPECIES: type-F conjugative transfer system protein TraW [Klebsiella]AKL32664.1 conjugal transfer protein TraW [Klebsiella oxytoca]AYZ15275.1 type-F conjugative transfer system protein TraW [Klebsiella sp. FDAARGOS_511]ELB7348017.1 type-F conjugative transfer system protein TraW [Klebsiella michiganensis]ELC0840637.1 type-F conjugative transfer system protein TraW [Klebsiella michiganensis]ELC2236829.1 type-F conjugative transfer system protein TraW [Klebsiella michiganensis]